MVNGRLTPRAPRRDRQTPSSLLAEQVGRSLRGGVAFDVAFEPRDLVFEQRDPFIEFADREQRQVLADLVDDFFLRTVVIVCRKDYRGPPPPAPQNSGGRGPQHT